jgi:hypothetical protein
MHGARVGRVKAFTHRLLCSMLFYLALILLSHQVLYAQDEARLSDKHLQKVNKQQSAAKKLAMYRKYYTKDSIKHLKKTEKYWQAKTDSLANAIEKRDKAIERKASKVKDGIESKIYKTVYAPWAKKQAEAQIAWLEKNGIQPSAILRQILLNYFEQYFLAATQNDSMLVALKTKMPSLPMPRQLTAKAQDFESIDPIKASNIKAMASGKLSGMKGSGDLSAIQGEARSGLNEVSSYNKYGVLLKNTDSRKELIKSEGEQRAMALLSEKTQFAQVAEVGKNQKEISKIKEMPAGYKAQADQLQDSAYVREQAKKKAEEMAMKYVAEHPELMQGVQKKMALLMKKYSMVPNSNDLSTAIKRSSLKGKPLRERLVIGGNFQVLSWDPFTIDFSPSVGYKFNRKFVIGIGGNYRQTFSTDTIPKLAPEILGYKAFANYDVFRNFFVYGEFDRNSPGVRKSESTSARIWHNAAFVGVGRKVTIHSKIEMTVIAMYNLIHKANDPVYPRPFVVRIGFQTSELALLKR